MNEMIYQRTFTKDQVKRMANILDNAGQVVLASVVIPLALNLIGTPSSKYIIIVGTILTAVFWWIWLRLERRSS